MFGFIKKLFAKSYEDLSGAEFRRQFEAAGKQGVLLDVRTAGEFKSGSIKSAIHMDVSAGNFAEKASKLDASKTYFVFCRSGMRSGMACRHLSSKGFKVFNLSGGIKSWPTK